MPNLPPHPAATDLVPVMVGTAGHVHHGKSALVKMLTGCDTMHLPEERSRKLTIDLGFASCQLSGRRLVGIVDVPGHEDFIRNMVAGAAAIDVLMLVVAADDGVMPQTREHLAIIATLRSPQAFAVVNKCDLVGPERRDEVAGEVRALLARSGFPDASVVCASCRTGDGLDAVYETLDRLVLAAAARTSDPRAFRMDVERVFSVPGHGTVATGVPRSGAVAVGEALELLPEGTPTQLKGAQAFKHETQRVVAGSCAALNLRDLAAESVTRGMTVAAPGVYRPTTGILVALRNVAVGLTIKRRQEVRLHAGTGATVATVKLLGAPSLPPGTEGFAALTLREPLVLAAGDRVLLRALSPEITVAGGTVLAASVPTALKDTPELVARLEHARSALPDVLAAACWAGPELSFTLAEARRLTQLPNATASEKVAEAVRAGLLVDLGEECLMVAQRVTELAAPLRKTLARFHAAHRLSVGMEPAQACAALGLPSGCFPRLAELIAGHGCAERHGRLALADFAPPVSAALAAQRDRLLAHLAAAGVNAPARGNLLKELALDEKDLDTLTKLLVEEGAIRLIGANLMPTAVFDDCRAKLLALFAKSPTVELAAFRAATGLSRNLGVGVLELFDREGLTRREGLARVLARKS